MKTTLPASRLSARIRGHLTVDLVILLVLVFLNLFGALIWTPLAFSSAGAFALSLYAISNVSGAKKGPMPCMHILRRARLERQGRIRDYEESCLRYLTVLLPVSVVWTVVNFAAAVGRIVYLFLR